MYNNKEITDFVNYVKSEYEARESDIRKAIDCEYKRMVEYKEADKYKRTTKRDKIESLNIALSNVKAWLEEPREDILPSRLFIYGEAKLYFNSIKKKG